MFTVLFVSLFVAAHATVQLPSYIHPCGRNDPNYDQCIISNIDRMKDKICIGIPELNFPPIEPLLINDIMVYDTADVKLYLRNLELYGFCDFVVNSVHVDPNKLHFNFDINLKNVRLSNVTYDLNLHLLQVQIANKGIVHFTAGAGAKLKIDFKMVTKNGKTSGYISKANLNLDLKYKYKFDESEKELVQIHEILNDIAAKYGDEILNEKVKPVLEREIAQRFITSFNNVFRTHYEVLFPKT